MEDVLCLILGGGRGRGLYPLTRSRSEPAVPLAGKYRLIDIPVSNCINSGVRQIYVLTQYLSVSLHRHLTQTYQLAPFSRGMITALPAQQTNESASWYEGTADAVRQNLAYVRSSGARDVLLLSGDQLYRMDFHALVAVHRSRCADLTVAVVPVSRAQTGRLGVVRVGDSDRVLEIVEKPNEPQLLEHLRTPAAWFAAHGAGVAGREYLGNMGIYLVNRRALIDLLDQQPAARDFVLDMIPRSLESCRVHAHLFDGYWEDVGTVASYYDAHMALVGNEPPFDFHSPEGVIYTRMRYLPASQVVEAKVEQCLIADGCIVYPGAVLERSVLGVRCRIGAGSVLRGTICNGATRFETEVEKAANRRCGLPDLGIAEGCVIERTIVDKDCRIGRGVRIINERGVRDHDADKYSIRDGVVVVPSGTVLPDGTVI